MKHRTLLAVSIPVLFGGALVLGRTDDPAQEIAASLRSYERRQTRAYSGGSMRLAVTETNYVLPNRDVRSELARVRNQLSARRWTEIPGSSGARVFRWNGDSALLTAMRNVPLVGGFIRHRAWALRIEPGKSGGVAASEILTETS